MKGLAFVSELPFWPHISSSGVYVITNVLSFSVPFLLLPVITRYLSPEEFGKVVMFLVAVNLSVPLVGFRADSAIGRQYYERDTIDFASYITNCLYILLVSAAIVGLAIIFFAPRIGSALGLPANWVWLILFFAMARFITSSVLILWQVQNKPKSYAVYFFLQTIITFVLSVFFIVVLGYG